MIFKMFVKIVTTIVEVIVTLIALVMFTAFALNPTEIGLFTNSLILIMIMVQLYTINVLLDLYEKLEVKKK